MNNKQCAEQVHVAFQVFAPKANHGSMMVFPSTKSLAIIILLTGKYCCILSLYVISKGSKVSWIRENWNSTHKHTYIDRIINLAKGTRKVLFISSYWPYHCQWCQSVNQSINQSINQSSINQIIFIEGDSGF